VIPEEDFSYMHEFWINTRDWMKDAGFRAEVLSPFRELSRIFDDWQDMYSKDNYHLTQYAYEVLAERIWAALLDENNEFWRSRPELSQYTVERDHGHGSGHHFTICLGNNGREVRGRRRGGDIGDTAWVWWQAGC
jgi:hypothetical protein